MESQLSHLVQERKSADKDTIGLRKQLAKAQDRVSVFSRNKQVFFKHGFVTTEALIFEIIFPSRSRQPMKLFMLSTAKALA